MWETTVPVCIVPSKFSNMRQTGRRVREGYSTILEAIFCEPATVN